VFILLVQLHCYIGFLQGEGNHMKTFRLKTIMLASILILSTGVLTGLFETQAAVTPELTVQVSPGTVDRNGVHVTTISGQLSSSGVGLSGKNISLYYSDSTQHFIAEVTTGAGGQYSYEWNVPVAPDGYSAEWLPNGEYPIIATFSGDADYATISATSAPHNLFVVPEYLFGGLLVVIACFGAFLVAKKTLRKATPL
jgi:hypothetical protein